MSANDLDSHLLNIDWTTCDWRLYNWDPILSQLPTLRNTTIHAIARAHYLHSDGVLSPIHLEQMRRFDLRSSGDTPPGKPLRLYFIDPDGVTYQTLLENRPSSPLPPAKFNGKSVAEALQEGQCSLCYGEFYQGQFFRMSTITNPHPTLDVTSWAER